MSALLYQVDAFASKPFTGNPAGVCPLESAAGEDWMQAVAREMNLSETAFLQPLPADGEGAFDLRWFTPSVEVALCGHATLASAHVLWETGRLAAATPARFQTKSGWLGARRDGQWIQLDFPATPPAEALDPGGLAEAFAAPPRWIGRSRHDYLLELESEDQVRAAAPDLRAIARSGARGVIVTARAAMPGYDFVSRFFAPAAGVDEDPVTGSAHCALAPYWAERLGKRAMVGWQASARGGEVRVELKDGDRVLLGGRAITVMKIELLV